MERSKHMAAAHWGSSKPERGRIDRDREGRALADVMAAWQPGCLVLVFFFSKFMQRHKASPCLFGEVKHVPRRQSGNAWVYRRCWWHLVDCKLAVSLISLCTAPTCAEVSTVVSMWDGVAQWQRKEWPFSVCLPYYAGYYSDFLCELQLKISGFV